MDQKNNNTYDESSIQVLEGLDAVRKRPGMYIGTTDIRGLHHLVWEIVDNSIDEALAGHCDEINISINKDNSITVRDNGRGVPTGKHKTGKSTPEVIFSTLHAGGKFGGNGYKTSGGLHGVGSSVVNALSSSFIVKIYREGKIYEISFHNGGLLKKSLKEVGKTTKHGTEVTFKADPSIFVSLNYSFLTISERIQESAFLNSGLKLTLTDLRKDAPKEVSYKYDLGLQEFITFINKDKKILSTPILLRGNEKDIEVEVCLQYSNDFNENLVAFANNVKTAEGGTHVTGFRTGLNKAFNEFARSSNILKDKDKNFDSSDTKEGLAVIVSVKVPENLIQYEGQTKNKLGTPEARSVVENVVYNQLKYWIQENPKIAEQIIEKAILARIARDEAKKAREAARNSKKRSGTDRMLVGKLTPAQNKNKHVNELFLVEGDSAGGSAKLGRDRKFQAILPLRGKVINAEKAKLQDIFNNDEVQYMINAIGAGVGNEFDINDINYGKVIIMTDADTDGAHIQTLILTFFYRYMRPLIENKKVYIALPPLYKLTERKTKKVSYVWDEKDLKNKVKNNKEKYELQRYKGLGEMNADQLWDTTMDPQHRQLILVEIDNASIAEKRIVTLMGDDAKKRKDWIVDNVKFSLEENNGHII
ncbi:DNA topoisomerase IV subunit B [Spiroplasma endosymbiont of Anurida maritima]|uniref:DNA topoisomerase IV subunit B n=1 Tax=Spiroplasma endosymbiont of Anurida maritima TaxID=2967972 RepID=UPI0036D2A1D3